MTVIRRTSRPADHYTTIANSALRDVRLSRGARGLLAELLSHEIGWSTTIRGLADAGPEGKDAISRQVAELKKYGYLALAQDRAEGGTFGSSIWDVTDEPDRQTVVTTPHPGLPDTVQPDPVNPPLKKNNHHEELHSHHSDDVEAVDNSLFDHHADSVGGDERAGRVEKFRLTPKRQKLLHDVMADCGQAYAIPEWDRYIRTVDWHAGEKLIKQWVGIRAAMRNNERNRRDDLNELLTLAGVKEITDAEWNSFIDSALGDERTVQLDF